MGTTSDRLKSNESFETRTMESVLVNVEKRARCIEILFQVCRFPNASDCATKCVRSQMAAVLDF